MKLNELFICRSIQLLLFVSFTIAARITTNQKFTKTIKEPTVRVQCLTGAMLITIKDAPSIHDDSFFSGVIYPKGLSKNSSCLTEYLAHDGPLKYKLPLRSCNTMPIETDNGEIEFFNTIVLQPHLKLVTDMGRGYHVRCRYKNRETATPLKSENWHNAPEAYRSDEVVDRRDHGRSLGDKVEEIETNDIKMPACHMKIFNADDNIAENVKIGDPLKLIVSIDEQEIYGLHVTDCLVRDGLGWGEQTLINKEGCPLDGEIMGPFQYSDDRMKAVVTFPAHKFPYTTSVYYQCNIRLCALLDPECKRSPTCIGSRVKRQTVNSTDEGLPATIEVYSGLHVNETPELDDDDSESVFREKTDDALCISQRSFAIAIAIAGLILMLAVIAAVLCIMARRNNKYGSSHSGSSIYSSPPYTNTAFSHSS